MPPSREHTILDIRDSSEPQTLLRETIEAGIRPLVVVMPSPDPRILEALQVWGVPWRPAAQSIRGAWVIELPAP